jgi:hypothetical protein
MRQLFNSFFTSFGRGAFTFDGTFTANSVADMLLGMPRQADRNPTPVTKPVTPNLEDKIYLTLTFSEGDNLQYMQHRLRRLWDDPARGQIPLNWSVNPLAWEIAPTILTASPGPGKGCLDTSSPSIPRSRPSTRTSSLKSSRSGSTRANRIRSGSPPTL